MYSSIAICLFVACVVAIIIVCEFRRAIKYRAKYPPISDDEFMEKLPPGTSRDVAMRVRTIVVKQMGVDRKRIHPDSKFIDF